MYVELINGSLSNRNNNASIVHLQDVQYEASHDERYISLFQYAETIKTHFESLGTVSGYKGDLYMNRLWIDIDNKENLEAAHASAAALINRLTADYEVAPNQITICFSGNKGYHIALHENLFGGFKASPELPKQIKLFVEQMCANIPHVDLGIYNTNRAFRALNSKHPISGLYKVGVSYEEFKSKNNDDIMWVATSPNESFIFTSEMNNAKPNRKLRELWEFVSSVSETDFSNEEMGADDGEGGDFFAPPIEGERNSKLFQQACQLFRHSELHFSSVMDLMSNTNKASGSPIDRNELYQLVRSAEQRVKQQVDVNESNRTWFTLAEQAHEIADALEQKSGNYSLIFPSFNEVVMGDLAGKLIIVAGQGGTKKSIFAQEFLVDNCRSGMRGVYNNQEMSKSQFLKRTINMYPSTSSGRQLWEQMREQYQADKEEATKGIHGLLKSDLAKRIVVDYKLAADSKYYKRMLEQITKKEGKVDMLIVDGLSMMNDRGTEKDSAEGHSRELKYLANEYNIPVIILVHVTKDIPKHKRDLTSALRASGKIYDNGDVFISCSLCIDESASDEEDVTYRTDIGYMRMFDKRESGKTINVVYEFDENTLRMQEHKLLKPSDVEVARKNKYFGDKKF